MSRIMVVQHVPFEGPALIAEWAAKRGHELGVCRMDLGEVLPAIDSCEGLVLMGGPMGVHDEASLPWLTAEKRAIRAALDAGVPMLGVCLGAQLIAQALGAPITRNPVEEIGWMPVRKVLGKGGPTWLDAAPNELTVLHWHGDTFATPAEAIRIFESDACPNQGFVLGNHVVALQFHLEMDPAAVAAICDAAGSSLEVSSTVQSADAMRKHHADPACRVLLWSLLDSLFRN